jgi:apolipoprotein N-acyltransferase
LNRLVQPILASLISALLLSFAFPSADLGFLVWIGLVPLLATLVDRRPIHGLLLSWLCGIVFFASVFSWLFRVPGYNALHHTVLAIYMGLYVGCFGWVLGLIHKRRGYAFALLTAPFIWVSLEYIRAHLGFLSLPWALLGHTQYRYHSIIQFAAFTGTYGVSFLAVLVNAAITAVVLACVNRLHERRLVTFLGVMTALVTVLVIIHGKETLDTPLSEKTLRISVVQANIGQDMKADPKKYTGRIMQKHIDLTHEAAKGKPRLIVWPEGATPGFVLKSMTLLNQITSLARDTKAHFLIGSSEYPKFIKDRTIGPEEIGNTALLFSPDGKILGQYLKIHLVPFGEYIPYEGIVPWPRFIVPEEKKTFEIPGKEYTIFRVNESKFGVLICWEIVFPELFSAFVRRGANFMLNITNEGWFGDSALYQLVAVSVFRAVENRVSLSRAANTGVSCFIDPYGRIIGRVEENQKDILVAGHLTKNIMLTTERTFYTTHGDLFVCAVMSVSVLLIALSLIRRKT